MMKNQIKYSLAGFCMGVAELIPGISGSTVAVIFKIYPNLMTILSQLRLKNLTLNLRSLSETFQLNLSMPLIFSMIIAVILSSRGIIELIFSFSSRKCSIIPRIYLDFCSYRVVIFSESPLLSSISGGCGCLIIFSFL